MEFLCFLDFSFLTNSATLHFLNGRKVTVQKTRKNEWIDIEDSEYQHWIDAQDWEEDWSAKVDQEQARRTSKTQKQHCKCG